MTKKSNFEVKTIYDEAQLYTLYYAKIIYELSPTNIFLYEMSRESKGFLGTVPLTHLQQVSHIRDTQKSKHCRASHQCDAGSEHQIPGKAHTPILKPTWNYYLGLQNIPLLVG